ncbi:hypothetical protein WJX74_003771 [Apatococcus lobatus]|uniref:Uncharacterized protein n=1 Tax=Apatococcus lobatus TaxID=904363 RepID=A0AAW1QI75_9CHLO
MQKEAGIDEVTLLRNAREGDDGLEEEQEAEDSDQEELFEDEQHMLETFQQLEESRAKLRAGTSTAPPISLLGTDNSSKAGAQAPRTRSARRDGVFGATADDIWDEGQADCMGLNMPRGRGRKRGQGRGRGRGTRRKAMDNIPGDVRKMMEEATVLIIYKKYEEASHLLKDVVKHVPNSPEPYKNLGFIHEELDDLESAINYYLVAAKIQSKDLDVWRKAGKISAELRIHNQAIVCYKEVLKRDREDWDSRFNLGILLNEIGEARKAADEFERIVKARPDDEAAVRSLASVWHTLGDDQRAVQVLETFLRPPRRLQDVDLTIINYLAELYGNFNRHEDTLQLIQKQEEATGLPLELQMSAALAAASINNVDLAQQYLQSMLEEPQPEFVEYYFETATKLVELQLPTHALDFYEALEGMSGDQKPERLWYHTAQCHLAAGDLLSAAQSYRKVWDDAQQLMEEIEADEPAETAASSSDTSSIMRRASLLSKLGQQDAFLTLMYPITATTLEHYQEVAGQRQQHRRLDPAIAKALKRRAHLLRTGAAAAVTQQDARTAFKGFEPRKDRRKPQQKVKDAALLAQIREAEAEQMLPDLQDRPAAEPNGPILDRLTSDEEQLKLWIAVGRGLISSGQPQACQQLLEDGLAAFGRQWTAGSQADRWKREVCRLVIAEAMVAQANHRDAFNHLQKLVMRWPHSPHVWNLYSRVTMALGGQRAGLKVVKQLRQQLPTCLQAMLISGHYHVIEKQHEQALGEYFQAYRLAPEHPIVLLSIATALTNQTMSPHVKDRDRTVLQAFAFMQEYALHRGDPSEAAYNMGRAAHQLGLHSLAVTLYQTALQSATDPSATAGQAGCQKTLTEEMHQQDADEMMDGQQPTNGAAAPTSAVLSNQPSMQREAAYNLSLIYQASGADDLAREVLRLHLKI